MEISKIKTIEDKKIKVVAGCTEGTILLFFQPLIDRLQENQPSKNLERFEIKRNVHHAEITCIDSNKEFIVFGSADKHVSVWKMVGASLMQKIKLDGGVSDLKFLPRMSHFVVLSDSGELDLCHPMHSSAVAESMISIDCENGSLAVSSDNGVLIASQDGSCIRSYTYSAPA